MVTISLNFSYRDYPLLQKDFYEDRLEMIFDVHQYEPRDVVVTLMNRKLVVSVAYITYTW